VQCTRYGPCHNDCTGSVSRRHSGTLASSNYGSMLVNMMITATVPSDGVRSQRMLRHKSADERDGGSDGVRGVNLQAMRRQCARG
jgi:hypothetical protein